MHYDHFKPKSYLKLIKKYVFSEGEQFPLIATHNTQNTLVRNFQPRPSVCPTFQCSALQPQYMQALAALPELIPLSCLPFVTLVSSLTQCPQFSPGPSLNITSVLSIRSAGGRGRKPSPVETSKRTEVSNGSQRSRYSTGAPTWSVSRGETTLLSRIGACQRGQIYGWR